MMYGSANRDETVFPDAATMKLDRPNIRSHVAFGYGAHFLYRCLACQSGALALQFERLLQRLAEIELAPGFTPRFEGDR